MRLDPVRLWKYLLLLVRLAQAMLRNCNDPDTSLRAASVQRTMMARRMQLKY
jgi:hypothetical protein